jgi:hypothetical protein
MRIRLDSYSESRFRPDGRGTFLCTAKEKYPKEKRPGGLPANAGPLRFSPQSALVELAIAHDAIAQTDDSLYPIAAAMLSIAYGIWVAAPCPVALTEYRRQSGMKARTLFEASLGGIVLSRPGSELCAPPDCRGTQGIGASR